MADLDQNEIAEREAFFRELESRHGGPISYDELRRWERSNSGHGVDDLKETVRALAFSAEATAATTVPMADASTPGVSTPKGREVNRLSPTLHPRHRKLSSAATEAAGIVDVANNESVITASIGRKFRSRLQDSEGDSEASMRTSCALNRQPSSVPPTSRSQSLLPQPGWISGRKLAEGARRKKLVERSRERVTVKREQATKACANQGEAATPSELVEPRCPEQCPTAQLKVIAGAAREGKGPRKGHAQAPSIDACGSVGAARAEGALADQHQLESENLAEGLASSKALPRDVPLQLQLQLMHEQMRALELKHQRRQQESHALIEQSRRLAAQEAARVRDEFERILQGKNAEIERFRRELDAIVHEMQCMYERQQEQQKARLCGLADQLYDRYHSGSQVENLEKALIVSHFD